MSEVIGPGRDASLSGQERYAHDERLRLLFEHSRDAIVLTDNTGKYLDVNPAACRLLGYRREQLLRMQVSDLLTANEPGAGVRFEEYRRNGHEEGEFALLRPDGTYCLAEYSATRLADDLHVSILRDVTDSRLLEAERNRQALRERLALAWAEEERSERSRAEEAVHFQSLLLDAIGQAVIATDLQGTIQYWNRYAETLYGWNREEALGRNVLDVTPTAMSREAAAEIMTCLQNGQSWSGEFLVQRRDGTSFYAHVTDAPIYDQNQVLTGIVGISTDVSEQRRLREAIQRNQLYVESLNERLSRAIIETHHRVKNNLQVISAMIDMQANAHIDAVPVDELYRLGRQVRTLAAVHDLLTEQAKVGAPEETISARAVLEKLAGLLQQTTDGRRIQSDLEDAGLTSRQATSLALIVNELVSNALKHGHGDVAIALQAKDGLAEVTVTDDGPGFPPDFDPAKSANTGLELVNTLARWDLRGEVRYGNRREGGARVTLTMPNG